MTEFSFSGDSRYHIGIIYAKTLLEEISAGEDQVGIASQIKNLEILGILSREAAAGISKLLEMSKTREMKFRFTWNENGKEALIF